jgi:hypothetical protein
MWVDLGLRVYQEDFETPLLKVRAGGGEIAVS